MEIIVGSFVFLLGIVAFNIQMAMKRSSKHNSPTPVLVQREKSARSIKILTATVVTVGASLTLTGCFGPPTTVDSLALDRVADVGEAILAEPDEAQKTVYKRELSTNYQAIGLDVTEDSLSSAAEWPAIIAASLKTCRELANGVSETDMVTNLIDDLKQQQPNMDPAWFPLIAEANLSAIRAPGSLCP